MSEDWGETRTSNFEGTDYPFVLCLRCEVWVIEETKEDHRLERCEGLQKSLETRRRAHIIALDALGKALL